MNLKTKILLLEDDTAMGFLLVDFLESNGFDVKLYADGKLGMNAFYQYNFDFCILDVMLPSLDGFAIAQRIRKNNKTIPIIFLTAKALKHDKITGFGIGVDDYIVKPFDEDELLCRINAILNRCATTTGSMPIISIGKYKYDADNLLLTFEKLPKRLTQKENEVLKMLACSKNNLVKRDDILLALWGNNDYFNSRSLDVFIAKLRKYLKADIAVQIENVPAVGYVLRDQ